MKNYTIALFLITLITFSSCSINTNEPTKSEIEVFKGLKLNSTLEEYSFYNDISQKLKEDQFARLEDELLPKNKLHLLFDHFKIKEIQFIMIGNKTEVINVMLEVKVNSNEESYLKDMFCKKYGTPDSTSNDDLQWNKKDYLVRLYPMYVKYSLDNNPFAANAILYQEWAIHYRSLYLEKIKKQQEDSIKSNEEKEHLKEL